MTTFKLADEKAIDNLAEVLKKKIRAGKEVFLSNSLASFHLTTNTRKLEWYFSPDSVGKTMNADDDTTLAIYVKEGETIDKEETQ